jgi:prevent-host-death family protein
MLSVGIHELRQRASELLRQVERGESIEITDRGRPVAVISPLPPGSPYRRMLVEGEIARASRETGELPEPLARSPGQESASAVLARLRSDER